MLAYRGGLDTSVAVPWLKEKYDADIITLTVDLGMMDLKSIRQCALQVGAAKAMIIGGKEALLVGGSGYPMRVGQLRKSEGS